MIYIVTYDIPNDKVRIRVSRFLEGWGTRVQESVFECRPPRQKEKTLWQGLRRLLRGRKGNIRIYQVCQGCFGKYWSIGDAVETHHDEGWFIID